MSPLGIPAEDVSLLQLEGIHRVGLRRATLVVWADLLGAAGEHTRPVGRSSGNAMLRRR